MYYSDLIKKILVAFLQFNFLSLFHLRKKFFFDFYFSGSLNICHIFINFFPETATCFSKQRPS